MKMLSYFVKTSKENLRDWKILVLALAFAPMFVYLMYAYLSGSGSSRYAVAVLNHDEKGVLSSDLIGRWKAVADAEGKPVLSILPIADEETGRKMIKNKTADLWVTLPQGFSDSFARYLGERKGPFPVLVCHGDPGNGRSTMAASFCDYATYGYAGERAGVTIPIEVRFEAAGEGRSLREFDLFFPALLVFSIIMVLFTAAATLVREVEKGTMTRLMLSNLSGFQMLGAVSLNQLMIGASCLVLTYFAGLSVGYHSSGSMALLFALGAVTCFSVISISIITACFIRTMFGLLTVGCFPFFILMFFSDCFMPLPKYQVFSMLGNPVYLNDVLPTAIATRAFNKILNFNAGFADVWFEFSMILALSIAYFCVGVVLFKRRHMSAIQ